MERISKSKLAVIVGVLLIAVVFIPTLASASLIDWWQLLILMLIQDQGRDLLKDYYGFGR